MATAELKYARLFYGASHYDVDMNDYVPFLTSYCGEDIAAFARQVLAVMSNASGGHRLTRCSVMTFNGHVQIIASGVTVYYENPDAVKYDLTTLDGAKAYAETFERDCVVTHLGEVITDQYGEGYKRAVWTRPEEDKA